MPSPAASFVKFRSVELRLMPAFKRPSEQTGLKRCGPYFPLRHLLFSFFKIPRGSGLGPD
jgi:hypothetical protein